MNVRELKEKLNKYPDAMDVFIEKQNDDFHFSLLDSVSEQEITFTGAGIKKKDEAKDMCLVLSDN